MPRRRRTTGCAGSLAPSPAPRARPAAPSWPIRSSPLGPLDGEIRGDACMPRSVPLLMGIAERDGRAEASAAQRRDFARGAARLRCRSDARQARPPPDWTFMSARQALVDSGVPVVEAVLASSEDEAVRRVAPASARRSRSRRRRRGSCTRATSAACGSTARPRPRSSRPIARSSDNARKAGFRARRRARAADGVGRRRGLCRHHRRSALRAGDRVRPRRHLRRDFEGHRHRDGAAVARRCAAHDPSHQGARRSCSARAAGRAATSRRWRRCWSISAASPWHNAGRFRALDLNPIIVKAEGEGVVAVDIAVDTVDTASARAQP